MENIELKNVIIHDNCDDFQNLFASIESLTIENDDDPVNNNKSTIIPPNILPYGKIQNLTLAGPHTKKLDLAFINSEM